MDSRYERIYTIGGFYSKGCPVIIVAGAILKDKLQGKVLLQLKFRNIAEESVISCKIRVYAFEIDGTPLPGIDSFSYLDICIPQGQEFGSQVPIYLPDEATRKVGVSFISVTYETYTWNSPEGDVSVIPQQNKLLSIMSEELCHTYSLETGIQDSIYQPIVIDELFLCTCGTVNLEKSGKCYRCNKSIDLILSKFNSDFLSVKTNERKQKEETERKQREEERIQKEAEELELKKEKERIAKEELAQKKKRIMAIAHPLIVIGVLISILFFVFMIWIRPIIVFRLNIKEISDAKVGNYIVLGQYEQDNNTSNGKEEITWEVLAKKDGKLLVVSHNALDTIPYNMEYEDVMWETCSLRKWLNEDFYNEAFSAEEKNRIRKSSVGEDADPENVSIMKNDTSDYVFILSIKEAEEYYSTDAERKCNPTKYAKANGAYVSGEGFCWWWLNSSGRSSSTVASINPSGCINYLGTEVNDNRETVRPALWVDC